MIVRQGNKDIVIPKWFKEIKTIQDRIDDERDLIRGRGRHPHATAFKYDISNQSTQTPTPILKII